MLWNPSANRVRENIMLQSLYEPHYRVVVIVTYDLVRTEELYVCCGYERWKSKPSSLRQDTFKGVAEWDGGGGGGVCGSPGQQSRRDNKLGGKMNIL